MENLELNYLELAYIMAISTKKSKDIFLLTIENEKVTAKDLLPVRILQDSFKAISSVDVRYDGINELIFALQMKSSNYKKFLSNIAMVKQKRFTSGKTIFYKICNDQQLDHIKLCFDHNFKAMFPKGIPVKEKKQKKQHQEN